ncbi:MAG: hypothetical protein ACRCST_16150 [Turicibacter sp.]
MNLLQMLFVPDYDPVTRKTNGEWLEGQFMTMKDNVAKKFEMDSYLELAENLKGVYANNTEIIGSVGVNGVFVKPMPIIDLKLFDKYKPTLFSYIRGFVYVLLIFYNIKQVIWLIRGTSPIGGGK